MGPAHSEEGLKLLCEGLLLLPGGLVPWVRHLWHFPLNCRVGDAAQGAPLLDFFFSERKIVKKMGIGEQQRLWMLSVLNTTALERSNCTIQDTFSWEEDAQSSLKWHFVLLGILRCCFDMLWAVAVRCNVQRGGQTAGGLLLLTELRRQIQNNWIQNTNTKQKYKYGSESLLSIMWIEEVANIISMKTFRVRGSLPSW